MSMFYSIVKLNLLIILINQSLSASHKSDSLQVYESIESGLSYPIDTYKFKYDYINPKTNKTLLQCAIAANNEDAVEKLLQKVDINQQDFFGGTALHTAVSMMGRCPNPIIVALLLKHSNINTKITNMNGYTATRCAKTYNHDKALKMLEYHDELIAMQQARERKLSEDRKSEFRLSETSLNTKQQKALESAKQTSIFSYLYSLKQT